MIRKLNRKLKVWFRKYTLSSKVPNFKREFELERHFRNEMDYVNHCNMWKTCVFRKSIEDTVVLSTVGEVTLSICLLNSLELCGNESDFSANILSGFKYYGWYLEESDKLECLMNKISIVNWSVVVVEYTFVNIVKLSQCKCSCHIYF